MGDILTIAATETVTGTASTSVKQNIMESTDVSGYDGGIDFQIAVLAQNSGGNGIKVTILTSMQNKSDDGSWVSAGQSATIAGAAAPPAWATLSLPTAGLVLFRYIRYQIDLQSSTTSATFSISGLAKRTT